MMFLAKITHPLVVVLSGSSTAILSLLGARRREEPPVTDDEIQGVDGARRRSRRLPRERQAESFSAIAFPGRAKIAAIMTPRREMFVIDLEGRRRACPPAHHQNRVIPHRGGRDGPTHIPAYKTGDLPKHPARVLHLGAISIYSAPAYVPGNGDTHQLLENSRP